MRWGRRARRHPSRVWRGELARWPPARWRCWAISWRRPRLGQGRGGTAVLPPAGAVAGVAPPAGVVGAVPPVGAAVVPVGAAAARAAAAGEAAGALGNYNSSP